MKKLLSMLLVIAMTATLLIGCGGNKSESEGDSGSAEAEKVTLDIIISQYGNYTQEWWKEFEANFEEANADIDLNIEIVSWNDIYTVVNTRISTNEQPDILNISGFADYVADDLLMPAEEYVSDELQANFVLGIQRNRWNSLGTSNSGILPCSFLQYRSFKRRWY